MTALSIGYLADGPDAGPILAGWFEREWGDGSPQRSAAAYSAQLAQCVSRDRLPVCLVGFLDEEPVATATLKFREIEFSVEADFWLGWVCVRQDMRGRGFGGAIVAAAESQAAALGLTPLFLHTPSAESFYRRLGWQTIGTTIADEKLTVVMAKAVSPRSAR
jgi:GNAT superfamily N-acetyltransferase